MLLTQQRRALESNAVQEEIVLSELELTKRVLEARGIPRESIQVLPGEITGTHDEAKILAEFLKDHPNATVTVVTNGFHSRRARWVFRQVLGEERADRLHWVGVPRDGVDEKKWWRTSGGWIVYSSEYGKFLYYLLLRRS